MKDTTDEQPDRGAVAGGAVLGAFLGLLCALAYLRFTAVPRVRVGDPEGAAAQGIARLIDSISLMVGGFLLGAVLGAGALLVWPLVKEAIASHRSDCADEP
jgi:hypothetical protein